MAWGEIPNLYLIYFYCYILSSLLNTLFNKCQLLSNVYDKKKIEMDTFLHLFSHQVFGCIHTTNYVIINVNTCMKYEQNGYVFDLNKMVPRTLLCLPEGSTFFHCRKSRWQLKVKKTFLLAFDYIQNTVLNTK